MRVAKQITPITGIETMQEGVKGASVEPTQMRPGSLTGKLTYFEFGDAALTVGDLDGNLRIRGPLSESQLTVGMLLRKNGKCKQWSNDVELGDVIACPANIEHDSFYDGQITYAALTLPKERFEQSVEARKTANTRWILDKPAIHQSKNRHAIKSCRLLNEAVQALRTQINGPSETNQILDVLVEDMISGFTDVCFQTDGPRRHTGVYSPHRLVRKAEEFMRSNPDRPIRSAELCRELGISPRSLYRAFISAVDMPPAEYLRNWRLNRVRLALTNEQDRIASIRDVAFDFGFWELGRFAGQYKSLFGELPSKTVTRADEICGRNR